MGLTSFSWQNVCMCIANNASIIYLWRVLWFQSPLTCFIIFLILPIVPRGASNYYCFFGHIENETQKNAVMCPVSSVIPQSLWHNPVSEMSSGAVSATVKTTTRYDAKLSSKSKLSHYFTWYHFWLPWINFPIRKNTLLLWTWIFSSERRGEKRVSSALHVLEQWLLLALSCQREASTASLPSSPGRSNAFSFASQKWFECFGFFKCVQNIFKTVFSYPKS